MKTKLLILALALLTIQSCNSSTVVTIPTSTIDNLIERGEYTEAQALINLKIATTKDLSAEERLDLEFKSQVMERIKIDFNKSEATVIEYIKKYYPDVTAEQIKEWEDNLALEYKIIDGQKKYFRNAQYNLFRLDAASIAVKEAKDGKDMSGTDNFLSGYLAEVVSPKSKNISTKKFEKLTNPEHFTITYSISVKPNEVPEGETVRVWMPYPHNKEKYKDIKLLATSDPNYIISPSDFLHKSIYMEKKAVKDSATKFSYSLEFTSYNQWFNFTTEDVKPYDKESELYKKYTAERKTHVIFTPAIKELADSIVGTESNPHKKFLKIFKYIADNYPWGSAREYSTIENIPEYVMNIKHGDCGQVSLLLITMCRYSGIPAKWQSGWMLHPGKVNLHDWAEVYFEGIGWIPVDQSFDYVIADTQTVEEAQENNDVYYFFTNGLDAFRYIVNEDYSREFYPSKTFPRSETVDFQRGEVEWRGGNLYFNKWNYNMKVERK